MTPDVAVTVTITDDVDIIGARKAARQMAERLGFSSAKCYRIATAVSELAHNLRAHALPGGTIRVTPLNDVSRIGIEIVCEDRGPGIFDIALAMTDGFSTKNGLGGGLPGTQRLMDEFAIESAMGVGTKIVARLWRP